MEIADNSGAGAAALVLVPFLIALYFIPTIVAVIRKVPNLGSVIIINLFLGWSLIGWVVALAMAARSVPPPPAQFYIQQQGMPPPPQQQPPDPPEQPQ